MDGLIKVSGENDLNVRDALLRLLEHDVRGEVRLACHSALAQYMAKDDNDAITKLVETVELIFNEDTHQYSKAGLQQTKRVIIIMQKLVVSYRLAYNFDLFECLAFEKDYF